MLTLPRLKWLVNGMLSLVSFFLSCAASLHAMWGGSHMVCAISLALTGDLKFHLQIKSMHNHVQFVTPYLRLLLLSAIFLV
jgi:hypothetical protein